MITVASRENFNSDGFLAKKLPAYGASAVAKDIFYDFCNAEEPGDMNNATSSIFRDVESSYMSKTEMLSGESHAFAYGNYVRLYRNPAAGEMG